MELPKGVVGGDAVVEVVRLSFLNKDEDAPTVICPYGLGEATQSMQLFLTGKLAAIEGLPAVQAVCKALSESQSTQLPARG